MFKLLLNYIHEYCDAPRPWGLYFQDSAAPQMEGLVELHDNIMFYLIIILFGVGWIITSVILNYASSRSPISHKYLNHGTCAPSNYIYARISGYEWGSLRVEIILLSNTDYSWIVTARV